MVKKEENIRKRKDGRLKNRTAYDGQTPYHSIYENKYLGVKEKLQFMSLNDDESELHQLLFCDVSEIWLSSKRLSAKGATLNKYHYMLEKHILPQLGHLRLSEINNFVLNSFLEQKLKSGRTDGNGGLSPSYVSGLRLIINSILIFSEEEGFYCGKKAKMSKLKIEKAEVSVINKKDIKVLEKRLYENLNTTNLGILLALQLGLRIGEVCALRWCDINFNEKVLCVTHTIARVRDEENLTKTKLILDTPKTKSSLRKIPICSKLFKALEKAKKQSVSEFVVSERGTFLSPRTFDYRFHQALNRFDIPQVNFHVLRHTFATMCVESGIDIKTLSEILGHSNVSITLNTYVHSSMDLKRKQLEKLYSYCG